MAIGIAVVAVLTGYAFILVGAWGVGAVTIALLIVSRGSYSILHKILMPFGVVFIVLLTFGGLAWNIKATTYEINHYEIYNVTAPFGVIWVEQTGKISGGLLRFSGTFNSELANSYVVKYFVKSNLQTELRTVITDKPLVIDGTFILEQVIKTETYTSGIFYNTHWRLSNNGISDGTTEEWIVHLPSLPLSNQTDGDYIVVP